MKEKKQLILFISTSILCLIVDQFIKWCVTSSLSLAKSIHIIRNIFRITYVQNTGAAWSILSGNIYFLIGVGILSIVFLFFLWKHKPTKLNSFIYGILLGGILGNLVDRIRVGYVIDYIDFNFGSYHYPIFNLADIFIVISILCIIFITWKEDV